MTQTTQTKPDWVIGCHLEYDNHGTVSIVKQVQGKISVTKLESTAASGAEFNRKPVFVGINDKNRALLMDPATKEISREDGVPADARFYYAYRDPGSVRTWFVNDGDENGNDTYACGANGSTISVLAKTNGNGDHVQTLCLGRGHHVVAFSHPTTKAGGLPHRAFASNLNDGTISVIGNDPNDAVSFLKIIATINLFDPRFEENTKTHIPNGAYPHGMDFSPLTGKIYNLNNGYGTVVVIDPLTHEVEASISMPGCSNLLQSRCHRYFIGKGADRKANPEHVMGKLTVFDATKNEVVNTLSIQDIYPSVYRFNPKGNRLYVTTAATGKGVQRDNLRTDIVQIYDSSALPELKLIEEIKLETTDSGRRPIAFLEQGDTAPYIFVPNPTQGTLAIIDGASHKVIEAVSVGAGKIKEFSFSFWNDRQIYGA